MNWLKILLIILAIGVGAYFLLWLFGIIYGLLWYIFWIGLIAVGGTVGYKLLFGKEEKNIPQLEEKHPIGIAEIQNADRILEEYKRKSENS